MSSHRYAANASPTHASAYDSPYPASSPAPAEVAAEATVALESKIDGAVCEGESIIDHVIPSTKDALLHLKAAAEDGLAQVQNKTTDTVDSLSSAVTPAQAHGKWHATGAGTVGINLVLRKG